MGHALTMVQVQSGVLYNAGRGTDPGTIWRDGCHWGVTGDDGRDGDCAVEG